MTETGSTTRRGPFTAEEHHLLKAVKRHLWGLSKRGVIQVHCIGKKEGKIQKWVRFSQGLKVAYQDGGLKRTGDRIKTIKVVMLSVSDFRRVVKAVNYEMVQSVDNSTVTITPLSEGYIIRQLGRMSALLYTVDGEWRWPEGNIVLLADKFGQDQTLRKRNTTTPAARIDAHYQRLAEAEASGSDMANFWHRERELYGITEAVLGSLYDSIAIAQAGRKLQGEAIHRKLLTRPDSKRDCQ